MLDERKRFGLLIIIFAAVGGMLYGYDIGIMSGALLFIKQDIVLTDAQVSFIVSAVLGGGAIATFVTGWLCDIFGRRYMMIAAAILFLFGVWLVVIAHSYEAVLIGRLTQGIGVGIITIAIPLYIAESVPSLYRGRGISAFQLFLTLGILLAGVIDLYFTAHNGAWRMMFLTAMVPAALFLAGCFILTNSPRWLMLKGREQQALDVLKKSRSDEIAQKEFLEMKTALFADQKDDTNKVTLLQRHYVLPLVLVFAVAVLNQLTGINSILQFSALILKQSGLQSNILAMMGSTGIMALNCLFTFIALCLIDKAGRKILLAVGTGGVSLALFYSGIVLHLHLDALTQGYLLLAGMLAFIIFFAVGPGVIVWLVLSELLPSRIRSKGMAVALSLNSLASTLLAASFLPLADKIGYTGIFFICAACTLVYCLLALFVVPETKGKTLEEIENDFI